MQNIIHAEEPLKLALQYAMTGNYIDFGTLNRVDEGQLERFLEDAHGTSVNPDEYTSLKKDLQESHSLVYLTDNCGEIVLDKLLMQEIRREFPQTEITVLVKAGDVLNDATMEEALQAMEEADVILAKG